MIYIDLLIALIVVASAVAAVFVRNLVSSVILSGVVSLLASYLFLRMSAPDVAMTEASIGAGLTTVIFLIAIRRTREKEEEQ